MGWLLALVGLAGLVVGGFALAKGHGWKTAVILLVLSWAALLEGALLAGRSQESPPRANPAPSPSPSLETHALINSLPRPAGVPVDAIEVHVVKPLDGDSISIAGGQLDGAETVLVLLSADSPQPSECYGPEAAQFVADELRANSTVYLVAIPSGQLTSPVSGYLWDSHGELINEKLAREGYARFLPPAEGDGYAARVQMAAAEAESANLGLWGECATDGPDPAPTRSPGPRNQALAAPSAANPAPSCEPSIPDFCVPTASRDLDCDDVGRSDFRVLSPDPHRLDDGGVPGVGCESAAGRAGPDPEDPDDDSDDDDGDDGGLFPDPDFDPDPDPDIDPDPDPSPDPEPTPDEDEEPGPDDDPPIGPDGELP